MMWIGHCSTFGKILVIFNSCTKEWGFWAWFQQTLESRQIVWMILFWMFSDFRVEVLEGFEAWFLQSFYTSECFWIFSDAACSLDGLVSLNVLGRLLFIGVWGWVSDTWRSLIGDTCHGLIGPLMLSLTRADVWLVSTWHLANFCWFLSDDSKT